RYYARSKNYQSPGGPQMTSGAALAGNSGPNASYAAKMPGRPGMPTGAPPMAARRPAPPTPGYANARPGMPGGPGAHVHAPSPMAPPMGANAGPTLFLIYNGQR